MKKAISTAAERRSEIEAGIMAFLMSIITLSFGDCSILTNPASDTVEAGYPFIAQVTVNCDKPSYSWLKNGSILAGAGTNTLVVDPVLRSDSGAVFSCIVSKGSWRDTSAEVVLTVIPPKNANRLIVISGDLKNAGQEPVGKDRTVLLEFTVKLYTSAKGSGTVYSESFRGVRSVPVSNGHFNIQLGRGEASGDLQKIVAEANNLYADLFTGPESRLELIGPRIALTAAPYGWSSGVSVSYGNADPVTADLKAAVGAIYVNNADTSTWKKTASGWYKID